MVETLTDLPPGVLGFRASGLVMSDELNRFTGPIDAALGRGERLNIYVELAEDFEGLDPAALREGREAAVEVGLGHRSSFRRLALVTDNDWVRNYVNAFGWMVPGELHVFEPERRGEALSWLSRRLAAA